MNRCWTHNAAYHRWILKHIHPSDVVLDVGCGDGLLAQKLADCCRQVYGVEPHGPSAALARQRTASLSNVQIHTTTFDAFPEEAGSMDAVIFVASLHHMDLETALQKAKDLLSPGGRLLVVGCAKPQGAADWLIELLRVIPARIGSRIHGEVPGGEIGVPTMQPTMSLREIRRALPDARIRRGLYYRYLLRWEKPR